MTSTRIHKKNLFSMHDDDKKKLFHIKKTSLNAFNLIEIDLFPYIKSYD